MAYKPTHARPSALARAATRGGVIAAAAAIAASGIAAGAGAADAATAPLQVTVGSQASSDTGGSLGNGTSQFASNGDVELQVGSTGDSAAVEVQNPAAPGNVTPPSFTTNTYGGGAPRWVLELQNGNYLFGYPTQAGGTVTNPANDTFTGAQWQEVSGNGVYDTQSFETYQKALQDAGDINGNVPVTNAFIVDDAPSAAPVDVSNIQYDGQTLGGPGSGAAVTVTSPGNPTSTAGTAISTIPVKASTNTSDQTLSYSASGLPAGLNINSFTGDITGTPSSAGTSTTIVTATDAYGDTGNQTFTWTVKAAPAPVTYTVAVNGTAGQIKNVHSGKFLNVAASSYATGSKLIQWDNSGKSHEKFQVVTIKGSDNSSYGFLEALGPNNGNYVVKASGEGQLTLGEKVPADRGTSSFITGLKAAGEDMLKTGSYYTFPGDSNYVMDVSGQSTANGAKVIAYPNNKGTNQQWSLP